MPILNWIGKDKVVNHHNQVPYRILEPQYNYGQNDNGNMIIHGDNLDALKALLPRFEGKVNLVYIDPPYNTGNEKWVYNDNVNDPKINKWLGEVVGKEGEDLGRHDKWLCMMYPRLKLLQRLLTEDGAIFISINDEEVASLKFICNEIFGVSNFVCQFSWRTDGNFDNQAKVKICHEYVLFYAKNQSLLGLPATIDPTVPATSKLFKPEIRNTVVKNGAKNPISKITLPIGFPSAITNMIVKARFDKWPHYHSDAIVCDNKLTNEVVIESGWGSKDIFEKYIESGFGEVRDSKGQLTKFEMVANGTIELVKVRESISHVISSLSGLGSTQSTSIELGKMGIDFDFPKPVDLVEYLISLYDAPQNIILDSFAGTAPTAHAVLSMNKRDGGSRKFILVEMEDYAENITAERIKRVIDGYESMQTIKVFDEKITTNHMKSTDLFEAAMKAKEDALLEYPNVKNPAVKDGRLIVEAKTSNGEIFRGTSGGFTYYELGERLLMDDGNLNENVDTEKIYEYIWYTETRADYMPQNEDYLLGIRFNTAYYFYYDKDNATVLDRDFLRTIKTKTDGYLIYADINNLSTDEMESANIRFKKIPRDITRL